MSLISDNRRNTYLLKWGQAIQKIPNIYLWAK